MISDLKSYPATKDSGVPWLGEVPGHWEINRLKTAVVQINEQTPTKGADDVYVALEYVESWTGRVRLPNNHITFDSQVKRFRRDDVLFGKLRPYLAKVARLSRDGVCVGEFLRYGRLTRDDYSDAMLLSPAILEAVEKVRLAILEPSDLPEGADPARYQAELILRLKDGREFRRRLPYPAGRYDDPTPKSVFVLPKFRENAVVCISETDAEQCIDVIQKLEELNELQTFTNIIKGTHRGAGG